MKYTYEEAFKDSLEYFNGDELAAKVFLDKYAFKDDGVILENTPDKMHLRMAEEFAKEGKWIQETSTKELSSLSSYGKKFFQNVKNRNLKEYIFEHFDKFEKIIPQGRVMAGLGVTNSYRSLSNCLRLPPPKDSYSSIMYTDTVLVSSAKRGCGYGLGISNLRPKNTIVKNSANSSTGAVSFMERFSFSTREVAQSGRRGACLIDIHVNHPDTEDFIKIKSDNTKVTGANVSVKYSDEFFHCLENKVPFLQRFPIDSDISNINLEELEFDKLTKINNIYVKKIDPEKLFELTIKHARDNAEPGVFFWDRMVNYDPASVYEEYKIDGTNACGEQPMGVYDTCRLILLNLYNFVENKFKKNAKINYTDLYETSYFQLILGDILVDLEIKYIDRILKKIELDPEPDEEKIIEYTLWKHVKRIAKSGRRVGCGITALGDMLAALNLKYDSDEAIETANKVMKTKMEAELDASIDLAIIRGSFNGYDSKKEKNDFFSMLKEEFPKQYQRMLKHGRRNVNWSTISPAGSVSILTQSTSSGEPLFSPFYLRMVKINPDSNYKTDFIDQNGDHWREEVVFHPKLKDFTNQDITKENIQKIYEQSPYFNAVANDIDWTKRVAMQSVLQKYTTSAISTTLNLPNNVSYKDVNKIYLESWKMGLKGQTVYRDGCRTGVLVTKKFSKKDAIKRPKELDCDIYNISVKGDKYTVIVGLLEEDPYEIFCVADYIDKHKTGKIVKINKGTYVIKTDSGEIKLSNYLEDDTQNALLRMISTSLRHGANIQFVVEQLNKTKGDLTTFNKSIARALKKYIKDGNGSLETCECGSNLVYQEGCLTCKTCGFSKCG